MAGPFSRSECAKIITSSIAVIPKKTVGKWRVIVDMSRPRGASVNDNLRRGLTHIAFSSVEETPACRASLGNTPSAQEHRVVADQYIQTQLGKGYNYGRAVLP